MSKIFLKVKELIKIISKLKFKRSLLLLYFFILFSGLILTFIYAFIPSFVTCSSLFGNNFCTPTGIFIALLASLPGYIISGNILFFTKDLPWGLSFVIVIAASALFYFILGMLIDSIRVKSLNTEKVSKLLITIAFLILFLLFVSLL